MRRSFQVLALSVMVVMCSQPVIGQYPDLVMLLGRLLYESGRDHYGGSSKYFAYYFTEKNLYVASGAGTAAGTSPRITTDGGRRIRLALEWQSH